MLDWFIRISDCIDLLEDMERKGLLDMDKVGFCPFSFLDLVHLIILVTVVSLVTSLISGVSC